MKIDKRRFSHWLMLLAFFCVGVLGAVLRCFRNKSPDHLKVMFYGHKLNGNLLALYEYMSRQPGIAAPVFLNMDRGYLRELNLQGVPTAWACGWSGVMVLSTASAVVTDHGMHSLQPLLPVYRRLGLRFYDVWHGIPFKGFDADDFRFQHRFDEVWVASEACKRLYIERFGFKQDRVVTTGYARTDRLLARDADAASLRNGFGLPQQGKVVLFAPTWKHDAEGRSIYPFGVSENDFLGALSALALRHGATVVLRSHLNSGDAAGSRHDNMIALPVSRFPDAEAVLLACDLLICDWSSIAFDFLLLDRPTIFLDVEPPFRKGFSLGPDYRFGPVVPDLAALLTTLENALSDPTAYWRENGPRHREIKRAVYGELADGRASERCVQRLRGHLSREVMTGSSR